MSCIRNPAIGRTVVKRCCYNPRPMTLKYASVRCQVPWVNVDDQQHLPFKHARPHCNLQGYEAAPRGTLEYNLQVNYFATPDSFAWQPKQLGSVI